MQNIIYLETENLGPNNDVVYYECTTDLHQEMKKNIWMFFPVIFGIHKSGVTYFKPQHEAHTAIYSVLVNDIQEGCTSEMLELIYRESHFTDNILLDDETCINAVRKIFE